MAPKPDGLGRTLTFHPEPGLTLTARQIFGKDKAAGVAVLLDLDGAEKAAASPAAQGTARGGLERRHSGSAGDRQTGLVEGHESAGLPTITRRSGRCGLVGRCSDSGHGTCSRLLDALAEADGTAPKQVAVVGQGPAGLVALCAGAHRRACHAGCGRRPLASYVSDVPYQGQGLGVMVPASCGRSATWRTCRSVCAAAGGDRGRRAGQRRTADGGPAPSSVRTCGTAAADGLDRCRPGRACSVAGRAGVRGEK